MDATPPWSSRLSRRSVLTRFGAAGLGVAFLNACAGSDSSNESSTTTTPTTLESSNSLQLQHVALGSVSAYVLLRGREAAVVDTGTSDSNAAIVEGLGVLGASWSDVRHVVLTHRHPDHVGGLTEVLAEVPSATVYAGEADLDRVQTSATLTAVGDGDEVLGMGVLNTPGHTSGSISLFDVDTGILVAGDALNGEDGRLVGADPRYSSDLGVAAESVAKMAALGPSVAAFGHGGPPIDEDVTAQLTALATA